jgi:hypothetical protein
LGFCERAVLGFHVSIVRIVDPKVTRAFW